MLSMYTKSQLHWQRPVGAVGLTGTRINDRYSGHYSSGWTIWDPFPTLSNRNRKNDKLVFGHVSWNQQERPCVEEAFTRALRRVSIRGQRRAPRFEGVIERDGERWEWEGAGERPVKGPLWAWRRKTLLRHVAMVRRVLSSVRISQPQRRPDPLRGLAVDPIQSEVSSAQTAQSGGKIRYSHTFLSLVPLSWYEYHRPPPHRCISGGRPRMVQCSALDHSSGTKQEQPQAPNESTHQAAVTLRHESV